MTKIITAVLINVRKWYIRFLLLGLVFILLPGCAQRFGFYFSSSKGTFAHEGHMMKNIPTNRDELVINTRFEDALVDNGTFSAEYIDKDTSNIGVGAIEIVPKVARVNLPIRKTNNLLNGPKFEYKRLNKADQKKNTKTVTERPVHKLSWLSFGLSMAGLILLIITISTSAPLLPFSLSFLSFIASIVTSRKSISIIKNKAELFSGKGLARAGFTISLIMLLLYVAFLLYILSFAGAFS